MKKITTTLGAVGLVAVSALVGAAQAGADAVPSSYHNGYVRQGNPTAKVVLTVTEDFACPACRQFEVISGPLLATLIANGKIGVDYRAIALIDRNFQNTTSYSARSAGAAACVAQADPSKYLAFHGALFNAQPSEGSQGPSDTQLVRTAAATGSTSADVAACILTERYKPFVEDATAVALGQIQGTPTVLVNGANIDDPTPANLLAAIAKAEGH